MHNNNQIENGEIINNILTFHAIETIWNGKR